MVTVCMEFCQGYLAVSLPFTLCPGSTCIHSFTHSFIPSLGGWALCRMLRRQH